MLRWCWAWRVVLLAAVSVPLEDFTRNSLLSVNGMGEYLCSRDAGKLNQMRK